MKKENKIRIPWYKRIIRLNQYEDMEIKPIPPQDFNIPKIPRTPTRQPNNVRQPTTQPATQPTTQPVLNPSGEVEYEANPFKFPIPIPLPGKYKQRENPFPTPYPFPERDPNRERIPVAAIEKQTLLQKTLGTILQPIVLLFVGQQAVNNFVEANVTDPIYNQMLQDPVLGLVLREAEKAELDMQVAVNYFANYDYNNIDIDQMTKELTALFGVGAATRIIVYFVGRRVLFRL